MGAFLKREDKKSLIELMKSAKDRISKNRHLVIFPEGTRNKNPKKLLKFKAGTKLIAEKFGLTIQPLLLLGIDEVVLFKPLNIKKGKLTVVAPPTVKSQKGTDWYSQLEQNMQKEIDKYYKNKESK